MLPPISLLFRTLLYTLSHTHLVQWPAARGDIRQILSRWHLLLRDWQGGCSSCQLSKLWGDDLYILHLGLSLFRICWYLSAQVEVWEHSFLSTAMLSSCCCSTSSQLHRDLSWCKVEMISKSTVAGGDEEVWLMISLVYLPVAAAGCYLSL